MTTFQHQHELKKLPIPPLEDSIKRYLEVLKPLQIEEEHQKTVQACNNFLKSSGPILQDKLIEYAKDKPSYIEQFWYDSYLNMESPVVLNVNPFFMIEDDPTPLKSTQVSRAASLTCSALRFVRALRKRELAPDLVRTTPLDMDQYLKLFGSARISNPTGCSLRTDEASKHIVVLSRSQFYWFEVLDENDEVLMSESEVKSNYMSIIEDSNESSSSDIAKSSFGILTTESRGARSAIRQKLNSDATNKEILSIIDRALFVIVLDNVEVGNDLTRMSKNFLCGESKLVNGVQIGTCTNRWYDKLQIIVTQDAKCGINFEHTGVDGHTVLRFASDIYTDSILRFAKTINAGSPSLWTSLPPVSATKSHTEMAKYTLAPQKMEWNLTKDMSLSLRFGETRLSDLIHQNQFATLEYRRFAKDRIKKMGMSPDAFVQMGFQLAYYALYGKVESTYEPAMTKMFYHGRTEAIRTVSEESNRFVTRFLDDNVPVKEKLQLLKDACRKHQARTRDCAKGYGQDRHLYALFCIWQQHFGDDAKGRAKLDKKPEIFTDDGWDKLNNTIISTSNCGNPSLKLFGFGPVSPNGFGVGYIIKDNWLTICASSKHRQTERFLNTLETCFDEMERTYIEATRPESRDSDDTVEGLFSEDVLDAKLNKVKIKRSKSEIIKLLGGYSSFEMGYNADMIKSREHSPEPAFRARRFRTYESPLAEG